MRDARHRSWLAKNPEWVTQKSRKIFKTGKTH